VTLAHAFITPQRSKRRGTPRDPDDGTQFVVDTDDGKVVVWRWGQGPAVLLIHGWQADHSDMLGFLAPLLAAGMSVITLDLPAHGLSSGETATIPQLAKVVRSVANVCGPIRGLIAHSMGAAVSILALSHGLELERVVLI
jgi:alpha-beta hydrolase superfamily lysophospholipase